MTYTYPDFYFDFQCAADRCRHSCCRGWEIDIDEESLHRYEAMSGVLGEKLRKSIAYEPTPHFVLDAEENCPFLQKDGLCALILQSGEGSLCDICAEHPRFYHDLRNRLEMGLGLCCEEAARLVSEGDVPWQLIEESDDGEMIVPQTAWLAARNQMIRQVQTGDLTEQMQKALQMPLLPFEKEKWIAHFRSLERMDTAWDAALERLAQTEITLDGQLNQMRYARLAAYFIYRHIESDAHWDAYVQFAFLSTRMICALEQCGINDAARLYSAEIEYSDENTARTVAFCKHTK